MPGQNLSQGHQNGRAWGDCITEQSILSKLAAADARSFCAMLLEANWSRSSSLWDMSRFKRPGDTLACKHIPILFARSAANDRIRNRTESLSRVKVLEEQLSILLQHVPYPYQELHSLHASFHLLNVKVTER